MRFAVMLAACSSQVAGTPTDVPVEPICDGNLQPDEGDVVDSPFDVDGDEYVTGDDNRCVDFYGVDFVDCDDNNPDVNPGKNETKCNGVDDDCSDLTSDAEDSDNDDATDCVDCDDQDPLRSPNFEEDCWDGADNNCDAVVDEGCGTNWNGDWQLDQTVLYTCALGIVDMNFDTLTILYTPPYFTVANGSGTTPGAMEGFLDPFVNDFMVDVFKTVGTAASCDEYYRVIGSFSDDDHFTATIEAGYDGGFGCLNCAYQIWTVAGTRITTP